MLTDIKIKNAKPGKYSDGRGDGLFLLVRPSGGKFWLQRIKVATRYREIGHGSWPEVSLADARRKAETTKEQAAKGLDPTAARKAAHAAFPTGHTLQEAVEGHIAAHEPSWRGKKTAKLFRTSLEQHAADLLQRDPNSITVADVQKVLAPIWTTKPVLAQKVRSRIEHSLEWATAAGWRAAGELVAVATVTETWGSSPRPAGSRLAVTKSGKMAGSVSGGCIEGAVADAAMQTIATGTPQLLDFGVSHERAWEVGLACGGKVKVFVEKLL